MGHAHDAAAAAWGVARAASAVTREAVALAERMGDAPPSGASLRALRQAEDLARDLDHLLLVEPGDPRQAHAAAAAALLAAAVALTETKAAPTARLRASVPARRVPVEGPPAGE
ncbi:MAG TPA: hypothetical protein VNX21_04270 [Candidatus Thermoplasmatota archaeon]|nr:hypothetical protein [Candidatus Thermoplasmatota archaeon]